MEVKHLLRNKKNDKLWDDFIAHSPQKTIYGHTWYLDIVCHKWEGIMIVENTEILAVLPLNVSKKMGITYSFQPLFTKYLGVFFSPKIKNQVEVLSLVIKNIPSKIKVLDMDFGVNFSETKPFKTEGYSIKQKYTYHLDLNKSVEEIYNLFSKSLKKNIRRAINLGVNIKESSDIEPLIKLKKRYNNYSPNVEILMRKVWENLELRKIGKCLYATNKEGKIIAGCILIINYNIASGMFLANNKQYKKLYASSLINFERLKRAKKCEGLKIYDFEGSMIKSIEEFFVRFNPEKKVYNNIYKNKIPLVTKAYNLLK